MTETTRENKGASELIKRIISAIVLAVVSISLTWHSFHAFVLLAVIMTLLLVWEWGKLTNNDTPLQLAISAGTITMLGLGFFWREPAFFLASLSAGVALTLWATHYWWRGKWGLLGLLYIAAPVLSLIYFRASPTHGFYAVLFILVVVWGTDTAAYFTGRHFGGKKLAPAISPGKTWSGAIGGLFAGLIFGALFAISIEADPVIPALIGLLLSAASQAGDLAESAIKRHFGVKDSSALIPGHGGILDRLDGVITAAALAAHIALLRDPANPAKALLIW